jgi:hypothetical protein
MSTQTSPNFGLPMENLIDIDDAPRFIFKRDVASFIGGLIPSLPTLDEQERLDGSNCWEQY